MSEYILHTVDVSDFLTNYRGEPFHAVLTDPPYGVGIGKQKWDGENPAWQPEFWRALMPHLLPNALVFAFGSARTYHYLASAAESGGFIIHNMMAFAYSNGLLKGASITQDNANEWWGYRYSVNPLKPAVEPILVCSKPPERSARYSIQRYGAGALNIKRAAIPSATPVEARLSSHAPSASFPNRVSLDRLPLSAPDSRLPSNFLLIHTPACSPVRGCAPDCPVAVLQRTTKRYRAAKDFSKSAQYSVVLQKACDTGTFHKCDEGTAERFFYRADWLLEQDDPVVPAFWYGAKAMTRERDAGLDDIAHEHPRLQHRRNLHPAIKPLKLCHYLALMLLPPSRYAPRRLFVPFSGTGSEIIGALFAGWDVVVGVEREAHYNDVAARRIRYWIERYDTARQMSFLHSFDTPAPRDGADDAATLD